MTFNVSEAYDINIKQYYVNDLEQGRLGPTLASLADLGK